MRRKRTLVFCKRRDCWHIDKQVFGQRICKSIGIDSLEEAEKYLARRIENSRQFAVMWSQTRTKV